uniref:Uncharacterized protein n=1 Tax=Rhizophora mucronata TaxID=61149 RepID=A0A2P2J9N5_RHIMU
MYARKGYELVKDLAMGEKGQLQAFNVSSLAVLHESSPFMFGALLELVLCAL